jgi:hypothetical protein
LEYSFEADSDFSPTYAVTARHHGILQDDFKKKQLDDLLNEAEDFCLNDYLTCLAKGETLTEDTRKELVKNSIIYWAFSKFYRERKLSNQLDRFYERSFEK